MRREDCCNRQQLSDAKNHSYIGGVPKVVENFNHGRNTQDVEDATRHKPERQQSGTDPVADSTGHVYLLSKGQEGGGLKRNGNRCMYCIRMSFRHLNDLPWRARLFWRALFCALGSHLCALWRRPTRRLPQPTRTRTRTPKSLPTTNPLFRRCPLRRTLQQTIQLDGKTLHYTVTVGALPVRDSDGKVAGEVVVTAYTMEGANRPVTFAFNGGPGAASVYLNFGAIGPKHLDAGNEGDSPSDPTNLVDNPGTWLDFTDLVFIDPIGTGFSRSKVSEAESKKLFYSTEPDIEYLSRIVYDWLVKNDRLSSRKYLVGESYGGFRGPRITHYLQSQLGVAMNGVVLVSPYLNPTIENDGDLSPLPWMMTLPSITAAHLEREKKLTLKRWPTSSPIPRANTQPRCSKAAPTKPPRRR